MERSPLSYLRSQWVRLGIAAIVFAAAGGFLLLNSGSEMESAPADGSSVRVLSGGAHTVYHSTENLPSASNPRADGLPTLVWFSATWCTNCAHMDDFTAGVFESFSGRAAFVEKSVDHDQASVNRYGVRGTPTFVLIDATGDEVGRFNYAGTADALTKLIEDTLAKQ